MDGLEYSRVAWAWTAGRAGAKMSSDDDDPDDEAASKVSPSSSALCSCDHPFGLFERLSYFLSLWIRATKARNSVFVNDTARFWLSGSLFWLRAVWARERDGRLLASDNMSSAALFLELRVTRALLAFTVPKAVFCTGEVSAGIDPLRRSTG